ncbi:alpha-1,4-N-acetylglucosaminyltransferase-like [Gastrophryne carolinensis]
MAPAKDLHSLYPTTVMIKVLKSITIFLTITIITVIYIEESLLKQKVYDIPKNTTYNAISADAILTKGTGIFFVENTDRMKPPSLVLCAVESAARVYPDRPVVFFMKGLDDISTEEDLMRAKQRFPTLSSYRNVHLFPLRMGLLLDQTPLMVWFKNINPKQERYWIHVSSDACRFAIIWKYGGIYMDTDIISMRPIPHDHFLAAEKQHKTSAGVFGLPPFHPMSWEFMENFVKNYRGKTWAHQGPGVVTRVVNKWCGMPVFNSVEDLMCTNIAYLNPQRFYPIYYSEWMKYFEVWPEMPTFNKSYALHFWNFMNKEGKTMVPGSNTLVEHLYRQRCPTTYKFLLKSEKG